MPLPGISIMRGRKPGEIPALLQVAAIAGGLSPEKIRLVRDKEEAADMAMARSGRGSLVVLLGGEDPAGMMKHLTPRASRGHRLIVP